MQFNITPDGNLEITCEENEKQDLQDLLDKATHKDHGFLANLLEETGWSPNGHLHQVKPEWIAALTDAPILTDWLVHTGDDTPEVDGNVWWFHSYQIESFAETLIREGKVVFTAAPENEKA